MTELSILKEMNRIERCIFLFMCYTSGIGWIGIIALRILYLEGLIPWWMV